MSKYICLCSEKFKNDKQAKNHVMFYDAVTLDGGTHIHKIYKIYKSHWKVRLLDWIIKVDIMFNLAFIAGLIINSILITHSSLNDSERLLEAVCAGIVLVRLFKHE